MFKRCAAVFCVLSIVVTAASAPASAGTFFGESPDGEPSVVNYGWQGFWLGTLLGLSGGYIRYHGEQNETKNVLMSGAQGGLAGAVAGLMLGFVDLSTDRPGMGGVIVRDMHLGGGLGLFVGGMWGLANALGDDNWDRMGESAAWGYIGGTAVGLVIGVIEGPRLVQKRESRGATPSLALFRDSQNNTCPGLRLACEF